MTTNFYTYALIMEYKVKNQQTDLWQHSMNYLLDWDLQLVSQYLLNHSGYWASCLDAYILILMELAVEGSAFFFKTKHFCFIFAHPHKKYFTKMGQNQIYFRVINWSCFEVFFLCVCMYFLGTKLIAPVKFLCRI